jgi:hypothetical protein
LTHHRFIAHHFEAKVRAVKMQHRSSENVTSTYNKK